MSSIHLLDTRFAARKRTKNAQLLGERIRIVPGRANHNLSIFGNKVDPVSHNNPEPIPNLLGNSDLPFEVSELERFFAIIPYSKDIPPYQLVNMPYCLLISHLVTSGVAP